jgi:exonuclease VII large subunit
MAEVDFPIHDPNRKLASVPLVHDHINERLLTAIRDLLPKQTLTFSGEVLRVRRSRRQWFFTVRGGKDADPRLGLQMILPIVEREPMCGQMIRVMGHLDARARDRGQIEIVVEGQQRCDEGVLAARYRKQIEALESLRAKIGHAQVLDLHRPVSGKVGLITGRVADAGADFERGLNQPGERYPIAVRPFKASLDDPTAIAEVIRGAAADDEVEVIAIVRGGGDPLGIHVFDDPLVLEAIAEAVTKKFVVMGVGHADDWSASEELASHVEDVSSISGELAAEAPQTAVLAAAPAARPGTGSTSSAGQEAKVGRARLEVARPGPDLGRGGRGRVDRPPHVRRLP